MYYINSFNVQRVSRNKNLIFTIRPDGNRNEYKEMGRMGMKMNRCHENVWEWKWV